MALGVTSPGTPTSALLHFFRGQNPAASPAAFIRVTLWLPTDAGDLWRLRYEIPSLPYSQEADCFFQDGWLDVCHRAAVADAGRGQHSAYAQTSDNISDANATTTPAPSPAD